ncbi:MAG: DUF1629 domain-containing protein [Albidovulum sp.]
MFTDAVPYRDKCPLTVPISNPGKPLDLSFAAHDMLVVSKRLGAALDDVCGNQTQRIPVTVEGSEEPYEILNILETAACLDEERSVVMYWGPEDDRPDKIGLYRMVAEIRIRPERLRDRDILRIAGWPLAVIVSERVRAAIEASGFTGARFEDVGP